MRERNFDHHRVTPCQPITNTRHLRPKSHGAPLPSSLFFPDLMIDSVDDKALIRGDKKRTINGLRLKILAGRAARRSSRALQLICVSSRVKFLWQSEPQCSRSVFRTTAPPTIHKNEMPEQ